MADEAKTEAPVKKKGKLPVIIVLALVLGAGGFFGMKARGGSAKTDKPVLKAGKVEKLDEFLVNLKEPNNYIRTQIALEFVDGFDKKIEEITPEIRDTIILKLSSKSIRDVQTLDGKMALKKDLIDSINSVLEADKVKKDEKSSAKPAETDKKSSPPDHPDWDSQTGPAIKVYFISFATQ